MILPNVEERIRLRNLVFAWIEPDGLFATCPTDPRFASAVKRWLPLSKRILIFGEETAKQAKAVSQEIRTTEVSVIELPAYVAMRFEYNAEFMPTAELQEIPLKKMVQNAVL